MIYREYLLVDGYNILNNWPELNKIKEVDLAHARDLLIEMLSNYQALTEVQVILVFDAHLVKGGLEKIEVKNEVRIIYSTESETADAVIEKLMFSLPNRSKITVATSDWAEQRMIMGKGGLRISARELWGLVKRTEKDSQKHFKKQDQQSRTLDSLLGDSVREALERWRRNK